MFLKLIRMHVYDPKEEAKESVKVYHLIKYIIIYIDGICILTDYTYSYSAVDMYRITQNVYFL